MPRSQSRKIPAPPGGKIDSPGEPLAEEHCFSLRKSVISEEPFDRGKAVNAFLAGLARLEPRVEVARQALRHDLTEGERARYSSFLLRHGSSRDLSQFIEHSLHSRKFEDDLVSYHCERIPASIQVMAARRMLELSSQDRSNRKGFALSAWVLATSSASAALLTEMLAPGRLNIGLLFEPGWNVSKLYSIIFATGVAIQLSTYSVLRSFSSARIRDHSREMLGSGKITDPSARAVLEELAGA